MTTYELRRALLRARRQYERSLEPGVPYPRTMRATVKLIRLRRRVRERSG